MFLEQELFDSNLNNLLQHKARNYEQMEDIHVDKHEDLKLLSCNIPA
jgi:hypothetical protein